MWAFAGTADERVFRKVSEQVKGSSQAPHIEEVLEDIEKLLIGVIFGYNEKRWNCQEGFIKRV